MFMQELSRRLEGTSVRVNAVHPGNVRSDIARDVPVQLHGIYKFFSHEPEAGAKSAVFLASDPAADALHGKYIHNTCKPMPVSPLARQVTAQRLWQLSEAYCGL